MTFQSSNRKAGLYFFGSDAANNSYHGNSYRIWQNERQLQICEQTPNSSNCYASANLLAANGEATTTLTLPTAGAWRLTAHAITADTQVGEAVSVITLP